MATASALLHTLWFAAFLATLSHSLSHLYYLFLARNVLTVPIERLIRSKPAAMLQVDIAPALTGDEQARLGQVKERVVTLLTGSSELSGQTVLRVLVVSVEMRVQVTVELEIDYPTKAEVFARPRAVWEACFGAGADEATVIVRSDQGKLIGHKIFQLTLSRTDRDFLARDIPDFDMDYKLRQLGAFIWSPAFPEAYAI